MFNTFHLLVFLFCLGIVDLSHTGLRNYVNRPYAQVRSDWIPTERGGRGSVIFPPSNTNAGQLNYQIQDAAKHRAAKDVVRSTSTTARSVYFQDYPELKVSQQSAVKELKSVPEFRPSPEYPITIAQISEPVLEKRENPTLQIISPYTSNVNEKLEAPSKAGKYIITGSVPSYQTVEVVTHSPSVVDYSDLVDAMEHLVERLNELETKLENQKTTEIIEENNRSLSAMNSALLSTKEKLESEISLLFGRTAYLEQRLSDLEEVTREWINPNNLGFYDSGKTTGKRGVVRRCPNQFFSLDEDDPTAPCYSISTEPNVRRNWQDANASCKEIQAKLAEPKSTDELRKLTDYLRYNRSDQIGGGYWTGGLNPGLMWLWPSLGISLTNIDPGMWLNSPDISTETNNGKCLRLSYDRNLQRYALQGSDCQRYLYFVCEYDVNSTAPTFDRLEKMLPNLKSYQDTTILPLPHLTTETPNASWQPSVSTTSQATTTTQSAAPPRPIPNYKRISWPSSLSTTTRSTTTTQTTSSLPPTPNYVGVIGFKGIPPQLRNEIPLNLAVLEDTNS